MKKGLFILSMPLFVLPIIGCNRASIPTSIEAYGIELAMSKSKYQCFVDAKGETEDVNKRVTWSVDKEDVATIDKDGLLTTKQVTDVTTIKVTAVSKVNPDAKSSFDVTVYPSTGLTISNLIAKLEAQEIALSDRLDDGSNTKDCSLKSDDFMLYIKDQKLVYDSSKECKYTLKNYKSSHTVDKTFLAYFKNPDAEKPTAKQNLFLPRPEVIQEELEKYKIYESQNVGYYNCFEYDSTGGNNPDTVGYYTYYKKTSEVNSSLDYRTFSNGLMTTYIQGRNDKITVSLHITPSNP